MAGIYTISKENCTEAALEALDKEMRTGWNRRKVTALQNQRAAQKFSRDFESNTIDGLGQCVLEVDTQVYNYWVAREGKEFWKEKANRDYFKRHFTEMTPPKAVKRPTVQGASI